MSKGTSINLLVCILVHIKIMGRPNWILPCSAVLTHSGGLFGSSIPNPIYLTLCIQPKNMSRNDAALKDYQSCNVMQTTCHWVQQKNNILQMVFKLISLSHLSSSFQNFIKCDNNLKRLFFLQILRDVILKQTGTESHYWYPFPAHLILILSIYWDISSCWHHLSSGQRKYAAFGKLPS